MPDSIETEDVLEDVSFIKKNYKDYFERLVIVDRKTDKVLFRLTIFGGRQLDVILSRTEAFTVLKDSDRNILVSQSFESIEQLISASMGEGPFTALMGKLVSQKFRSL